MDNKLLSVIIPIYNVENYLVEALDSIVNQDIGFMDNIQLILVNDGSPDNSEAICLEYKEKYPTITYISQKNQGVSAARNRGLEAATGKYIAFFDPDDMLSLDTYRLMINFFEEYYDEIDIAAFKMRFFERFTGEHPLNYRFRDGSRVVDVRESPTFMQSSGVSCVYKAEALKGVRFDGDIKFAEDMKLINEVLLAKMKYGIVDGPVYFVRKRMDENSASNTGHMNPSYYTVTPKKVFKHLFDLWEETNGKLDDFIQFVVLFDLQFRINQISQSALTQAEEDDYKKAIVDLLKRITNDRLILEMPKINIAYKFYMLRLKYGQTRFNQLVSIQDGVIHFNGVKLEGVRPGIGIDRIEVLEDGRVQIEGYVSGLITTSAGYWVESSEARVQPERNKFRSVHTRNVFLGEQVDVNEAFRAEVQVGDTDSIIFYYSTGAEPIQLSLKTSYVSGLGNISGAYSRYGKKIIKHLGNSLKIKQANRMNLLASEVKFSLILLSRLKLKVARRELEITLYRRLKQDLSMSTKIMSVVRPFLIPFKALALNVATIGLRLVARIAYTLKTKPVWLISDRISGASDNGEAFYEYLLADNVDKICYFAINKESDAYNRLQQKGFKVVNILGIKYKFLVLIADRVISSNADDLIYNPFLNDWSKYVDLMNFKFVFLQHGIIKDDLSKQYNRWNSKFDMLVTSTQQEYDSIVGNKHYGFSASVVKLTGMPRMDKLTDSDKGKIALIPTWRKGLDGGLDIKTGLRKYSPDFKNTEYFNFYNSIINDQKLKEAFEAKNLVGEFYLHPSFIAQSIDFDGGGCFEIKTMPYNFKKIFSESSMLVTDYSSVAFDFAYLEKPVIYVQFDKDEFFKSHTYKEGYYSYADDGFGPVTTSYDELVDAILQCIDNKLDMLPKYRNRVKRTFKYTDKHNSKRVYDAIEELA